MACCDLSKMWTFMRKYQVRVDTIESTIAAIIAFIHRVTQSTADSILKAFLSYGSVELIGHVYSTQNATTLDDCATLCYYDNEVCKSLNYDIRRKLCFLNTRSISTDPNGMRIVDDEKSKKVYYEGQGTGTVRHDS